MDRIPQGPDVLPLEQAVGTEHLPQASASRHLLQRSCTRSALVSEGVHVMQPIDEERQSSRHGSNGSGAAAPNGGSEGASGHTALQAEIPEYPPRQSQGAAAATNPEISAVVDVPTPPELPMPASMKALNAPHSIFGNKSSLQDSAISNFDAPVQGARPAQPQRSMLGQPGEASAGSTWQTQHHASSSADATALDQSGGRGFEASGEGRVPALCDESHPMTESPPSHTDVIQASGSVHGNGGGCDSGEQPQQPQQQQQEQQQQQNFAFVSGSGCTVSQGTDSELPGADSAFQAGAGRRQMHIFKPQNPYTR